MTLDTRASRASPSFGLFCSHQTIEVRNASCDYKTRADQPVRIDPADGFGRRALSCRHCSLPDRDI